MSQFLIKGWSTRYRRLLEQPTEKPGKEFFKGVLEFNH
jgi:hypothetical protein